MLTIIFIPVVNVFRMAFSKTDQVGRRWPSWT